MERRITPEAIQHDIDAIDLEIEKLKAEREGLASMLRARQVKTKSGRKARLRGGTSAYRDAVYNALTQSDASIREIADRAGISVNAAMKHLRVLEKEGLARETTGNESRHLRWVRREVKITPGQPVPAATPEQ